MAKDILLGDKEFKYEETETGFAFFRRLDENMSQGVFLKSPLSDHDSFIMGLREYLKDHKNVNLSDIQVAYEKIPREDAWIKNDDKKSSLEVDETLKHTFGGITFSFGIMYPSAMFPKETILVCKRESDDSFSNSTTFDIKGNIDTAKMVINNTIKYFDQKQDVSLLLIDRHLSSQMMDILQEDKIKNPQNLTVQLAKKAGYVQGVCECVAAIGDDHALGKKLLSEMNVTRDTAKKYANPETFKALEQGIFAQQQKIEQTHSIKR